MSAHRIAAVIKHSSSEEFLLVRQIPPPALKEEEYQRYVDSDLWDLPSAPLNPLEGGHPSQVIIEGGDSLLDKIDLTAFDVGSALAQISSQIEEQTAVCGSWSVFKYLEEPDFGPDSPVKTLFILGTSAHGDDDFSGTCKWMSKDTAIYLHLYRIGSLTVTGLLHRSDEIFIKYSYQEFPLGITVIPMRSRTPAPFHSTNLVVLVAGDDAGEPEESSFFKFGDALLVDPGCSIQHHSDLENLVTTLPRNLLVFLTHHHYDHVDGLSVINKCNPDAILMAHKNTLSRIDKGIWSHERLVVSGGEKIHIGSEKVEVVFAPGHTDGHTALLHLNTRCLIAGDHCVGQGSAVLDITSGGSMMDYFQTTYKFLDLLPSALIPMHGWPNVWPENLLCGYLKHRRDREAMIFKAIENGAKTLYDIVAFVYVDVDVKFWIAASSNVRLHVEHLACQGMLPKDFSLEDFNNNYDEFIERISKL